MIDPSKRVGMLVTENHVAACWGYGLLCENHTTELDPISNSHKTRCYHGMRWFTVAIRENDGTMLFEIVLEHFANGELRNTLPYLLQSEVTELWGVAQRSMTLSIHPRTDP